MRNHRENLGRRSGFEGQNVSSRLPATGNYGIEIGFAHIVPEPLERAQDVGGRLPCLQASQNPSGIAGDKFLRGPIRLVCIELECGPGYLQIIL